MVEQVQYKYLLPKIGSSYRQLYVEGRIRAGVIYRETVGLEPLAPEQVASGVQHSRRSGPGSDRLLHPQQETARRGTSRGDGADQSGRT